MTLPRHAVRMALLSCLLTMPASFEAASAAPREKITFLLPGPENLPAFVPYQLARTKGYFEQEDVDVTFLVGKGGADVAKQVAVRNADLGGGLGDTPIIVRANGLPVKGVALLGGGGLTQIIARRAAGINTLADLKGKRIGVVAFQNTNFYALLAMLARNGIAREDVSIRAVGQAGVIQLMISGDLDAISNVPENATQIEAAGVEVASFPVTDAYPAVAQAILASDAVIAERPGAVRGFVRAVLHALRDVMADPSRAAHDYVASMPMQTGREAFFEDVLHRYAEVVYRVDAPEKLGKFDAARLQAVENLYLSEGVIHQAVAVQNLFTNEFVK